MGVVVSKKSRQCATCQYWNGAREIRLSGSVLYDGKGICTAVSSPYRGKEVSGGRSCSYWRQWAALS